MTDHLTFELTEDHLKLLSRAYTGWQYCETGAPEIDPKRPYGNSYVAGDVAEILEWEPASYDWDDRVLSGEQVDRALALHHETEQALEIVLRTRSFVPGTYVTSDRYSHDWKLESVVIVPVIQHD